jgi:hypothetical protein
MPKIVSFVEGEGDEQAVPLLLDRVLLRIGEYGWNTKRTIRVGNIGKFRKRLDDYLSYVRKDPDCSAALVLLDLDDGCPLAEATKLATEIRAYDLPFPTAVVFAHREYEAWFLASIWSISFHTDLLPSGLKYMDEPEEIRGAKGWINQQMGLAKKYKETIHQQEFTRSLSFRRAYMHSRSFRRLCSAVNQLVQHSGNGKRGIVTP